MQCMLLEGDRSIAAAAELESLQADVSLILFQSLERGYAERTCRVLMFSAVKILTPLSLTGILQKDGIETFFSPISNNEELQFIS